MFSAFMVNAWTVASIVAVVAGLVGFFAVLRGSAFAAHAVPNGSFAGAAGASLLAVNTLLGLGVFSLLGALGIALLGRRGRHDAVTALTLVMMLALGALFVSFSEEYSAELYSLVFGEVLGVSANQVLPTVALACVCALAIALLYRPLLFSSALQEVAQARGVSAFRVELGFLAVLALASTMTVPVVGTLLVFALMIGPPAAARSFTDKPHVALALSVGIALVAVWGGIAVSYQTNEPVGFFVTSFSAGAYAVGRVWAAWRRGRLTAPAPAAPGGQAIPASTIIT